MDNTLHQTVFTSNTLRGLHRMVNAGCNARMDIQDVRRARLQAIITKGWNGNVTAFATSIHKSPTQIADMLAGRKSFGEKVARDIEKRGRLGHKSLDGELTTDISVADGETNPAYVRFPLLEGFAGMGRGDYVGDYPEVVNYLDVTLEWAAQTLRGVPSSAVRVITGRGPSMRGVFDDGDLVFLDSRVKEFVGDSAYCFRWNGLVYVKRLQMIGKGRVRIVSANPDYPPVDAPLNELEIGGRAIAAWTLRAL